MADAQASSVPPTPKKCKVEDLIKALSAGVRETRTLLNYSYCYGAKIDDLPTADDLQKLLSTKININKRAEIEFQRTGDKKAAKGPSKNYFPICRGLMV